MRNYFLAIAYIFMVSSLIAENKEPCEGVTVLSKIKDAKIIFEIPTYDEYMHSIVIQSMATGNKVSESNTLSKNAYAKVREAKVNAIKNSGIKDFSIMTRKQVRFGSIESGYIFQEKLVSDLVTSNNTKFEQYTIFSIKNVTTSARYTLIDPSNEVASGCLVNPGEYKFNDLVNIIKK